MRLSPVAPSGADLSGRHFPVYVKCSLASVGGSSRVPSSPSMRSLHALETESPVETRAINAAMPERSWSAVSPASNSPEPQGLCFVTKIKVKSEFFTLSNLVLGWYPSSVGTESCILFVCVID